eukprot:scaffold69416_cov41-Phaeocystis_antarctica.AAC.2
MPPTLRVCSGERKQARNMHYYPARLPPPPPRPLSATRCPALLAMRIFLLALQMLSTYKATC